VFAKQKRKKKALLFSSPRPGSQATSLPSSGKATQAGEQATSLPSSFRVIQGLSPSTVLCCSMSHSLTHTKHSDALYTACEGVCVCVECLIGKQKKPILVKVTKPSSVPYRTPPAYAKRAEHSDPPPVTPVPESSAQVTPSPGRGLLAEQDRDD
jgi:hypothetical protein